MKVEYSTFDALITRRPSRDNGSMTTSNENGGSADVAAAASRTRSPRRFAGLMQHAGRFWLIGCLLLASFLGIRAFAPSDAETHGTLTPPPGANVAALAPTLKNIEDIRVGERVKSHNPELPVAEHEKTFEINPDAWRRIELQMAKEDGTTLRIELLRSQEWIESARTESGDSVFLRLPDLGAVGPAEILAIGPCPSIAPGAGRIVTGAFRHESRDVLDLYVEGLDAPIGVTANHPFWSEDRRRFVAAGELQRSESLRLLDGLTAGVTNVVSRQSSAYVYNLEVETEHAYYVSTAGVLVHNSCNERTIFRALNEDDLLKILNGEHVLSSGVIRDIEAKVKGLPTKYISASDTLDGARRFQSAYPIVELNVEKLRATGSGVVDHKNVLQALRDKHDIDNATKAVEVLIKNGFSPNAIVRIHF